MDNQKIKCAVIHCQYYEDNCCTLGSIKVSNDNTAMKKNCKESTKCDSYKTK